MFIWEFIGVFAVAYIWHSLGITIGYHRLLSHRSFACPKWFEYFWVIGGYLAFQGSPIWWASMHRAHHRYEDTALDPHSPKFGSRNAYFGWMLHSDYPTHVNPAIQSKDLLSNPIYRFLEQNGDLPKAHVLLFVIALAFRLLILCFFGWIPALASLLAGLAAWQVPLLLNVLCHMPKLGYKNYKSTDDSVNVWWIGLLAMGEGWHNNHHAAPGSAKTGMRPWEFDASWLIISAMHKVGIVSRVTVSTDAQLMRNTARKIELAARAPIRVQA